MVVLGGEELDQVMEHFLGEWSRLWVVLVLGLQDGLYHLVRVVLLSQERAALQTAARQDLLDPDNQFLWHLLYVGD
jgi:hypothetical protein